MNAESDWTEVDLWAEIHRLRAAVAGPDGYASWQDAATDERIRRGRVERELRDAQATIANYRASHDALRDWAQECRDQVLYIVAQRDDALGRAADGLGQASSGLLGPNVRAKQP